MLGLRELDFTADIPHGEVGWERTAHRAFISHLKVVKPMWSASFAAGSSSKA